MSHRGSRADVSYTSSVSFSEECKMKQDRMAGKVAFTDDLAFCSVDGSNFFWMQPACCLTVVKLVSSP